MTASTSTRNPEECNTAKSHSRPKFVREETWRYLRVKESWRSPKGKTSRLRRSKKGWPAVVKIGYSRPTRTKGTHPSGLREVLVYRPKDLEKLDPKTQAARIAHTVGENKRALIIEEAKKANIRILNPRLKKPTAPEAAAEPKAEEKTEEKTKGVEGETTKAPPSKESEEEE